MYINIKDIWKSYGNRDVLRGISFSLASGEKVALVGHNGVGKSTLLKIIAGLEAFDKGEVFLPRNACIGYLPQEFVFQEDETVKNCFWRTVGIAELKFHMEELLNNLEDERKIEKFTELQEKYQKLGGENFDYKIKIILAGLGLAKIELHQKLKELSAGQKTKIILGAILLKGADLLLLDEPTNNLDIPALIWLEEFLKTTSATCLVVSHDKKFLDNIASRVLEIDWETRKLNIFRGKYSEYLDFKIKQLNRLKEEFRRQQEKINNLKKVAEKNKNWARKGSYQLPPDNDKYCRGMRRDRSAKLGRKASVIKKKLERIKKIDLPIEREPLTIDLNSQLIASKPKIILKEVIVGYKDSFQLGPINLEIAYGDRIGILGLNGAGKSTLLKVLSGRMLPLKGEIKIGKSLIVGDLIQEENNLPLDKTCLEFIEEKTAWQKEKVINLIHKFNFSFDEATQTIKTLSSGQRTRLLLAYFSAISANVLILDEPTNHLDLEAIEALKEVLKTYKGTIIVVSHDRDFIEQIKLTNFYVIEDGKLKQLSSYSDYLAKSVLIAKRIIHQLNLERRC